jgi:predicted Rossmann fold nucleotide-binding protein DprA/Smf involved in DNA uptake
VSGGAIGVDTAAEEAARYYGLQQLIFKPDYELHGRQAPLIRNRTIVNNCDRLVAFRDGKSTGTMHTVRLAEHARKPVDVFTAS